MSNPPAWFAAALERAQRIDNHNRWLREHPGAAADTPILESVMHDFAYGNPPFGAVADQAGDQR